MSSVPPQPPQNSQRLLAMATDYDGTLAEDGHVLESTAAAVTRLRESGRRVLMVTGRELPELHSVCPYVSLFNVIVAENGAVLYWPETEREEVLCSPIPPDFIAEMNRQEVRPFSVGRSIFATWRPHEFVVQATIDRLGMHYHIIFNKRAVMVLPNNVNKASGMSAALARLGLLSSQVVGVGDAENDLSFLRLCGVSAAVANALPSVKQECDLITLADHGLGVEELIDRLIADELSVQVPTRDERQASPSL